MKARGKNQVEVVKRLLQVGAFLQKTGNRLTGEYGLTQQQYVVLNEIVERGAVNQTQIVGALLFEKSNVSKIVKKLHTAGLIHVAGSTGDARTTVLSVTRRGHGVWRECLHALNSWSQSWLEPLDDEVIESAARILGRIGGLGPWDTNR